MTMSGMTGSMQEMAKGRARLAAAAEHFLSAQACCDDKLSFSQAFRRPAELPASGTPLSRLPECKAEEEAVGVEDQSDTEAEDSSFGYSTFASEAEDSAFCGSMTLRRVGSCSPVQESPSTSPAMKRDPTDEARAASNECTDKVAVCFAIAGAASARRDLCEGSSPPAPAPPPPVKPSNPAAMRGSPVDVAEDPTTQQSRTPTGRRIFRSVPRNMNEGTR